MSTARVILSPREPLLVGAAHASGSFRVSMPYVPARVVRGTWSQWIAAQGQSSGILPRVRALRIGNFYPYVNWRPVAYVAPLLMSMITCKEAAGFASEPYPDRRGHGVLDILLPRLAYHLLELAGARFPIPFGVRCRQCNGRMDHLSGSYVAYRDAGAYRYVRFRPRYHGQTKVALSRRRRAAVNGMLYHVTALAPLAPVPDSGRQTGQVSFLGRVDGPPEGIADLCQALNERPLGALGTRGYGSIEARMDLESEGFGELRVRVGAFNVRLAELWTDLRRIASNATQLPERPPGTYFSVDLLSPGVFRRGGLPALVPSVSVGGTTLEPVSWMTRAEVVGGWSTAWGMRKPTYLAARPGSVYVFRWDQGEGGFFDALEQLEARGIGEGCEEGYGEALVCHPFHLEDGER